MVRGYGCRLYPTKEQKVQLSKYFGGCRWFYNWALEKSVKTHGETKKNLSRIDLQKFLPILKKQKETAWLAEIDSAALQISIYPLETAFLNFFKRGASFPKFKNKDAKQSFTTNRCRLDDGKLFLGKFASTIKLRGLRDFKGELLSVTVTKSKTNKFHASFLVDDNIEPPHKVPVTEQGTIGIDLGLIDFVTLSNGEKVHNPKHAKKLEKILKRRSRQLAKSKAGSHRRVKRKLKVALIHEKIVNQRKDFLHKLSSKLIRENQAVAIEDLAIGSMVKNRHLARSISQASWGTFVGMLKYKADWHGKTILQTGRFEPSSKLCTCGQINRQLTLGDRIWTCPNCGVSHDRDVLAANNIKRIALHPSANSKVLTSVGG